MKPLPPSCRDLLLGTFGEGRADAFTVRLQPRSLDDILHRMELFRQCRALNAGVHEMVFEDSSGGFFFSRYKDTPYAPEAGSEAASGAQAWSIVADELVVCDFAVALSGTLSQWTVTEQGRFHLTAADALVAVQWRAHDVSSEIMYHSHPLWEDELERIKGELLAHM